MAKKQNLKVIVTLQGDALNLVTSEQKKYQRKKQIRGKNKLINLLLSELHQLRAIFHRQSD